ncbi:MAG: DEAD/DEAH box helicase, partial [Planctomycetaceae bacterium]
PYCIVLTGTPLENRLEELVSIVQFIDQHRLGPTYRFLHEHQVRDETGRVVGYKDLDLIGATLQPILIRRRKQEVLDQLPERLENNVFVPMTPQQQEHHDANKEFVAKIVQKWRRMGFLREADQRRLMIGLQNMRMSCDSTYLLDQSTDHSIKPNELMTLLGELFEEPQAKAVVFSQWTRMHELSRRRLAATDWEHVFFHGGVPSGRRGSLVDRFRNDPGCRLFLATDAGGVGLNLQHASAVINLDLPWNPAVLEQRIGRVHRLGQQRPVQVVNFVSQGTIEEGMLNVLAFKKSLFSGVLDGGETEVFLGGSRLKQFIETVEKVTTAIPRREPEPPGPSVPDQRVEAETAPEEQAGEGNPWEGLLQSGMALLEQLAAASRDGGQA